MNYTKWHQFDEKDALLYGVEIATMLFNYKKWLEQAVAFIEDIGTKGGIKYHWAEVNIEEITQIFPYWHGKSYLRRFREMVDKGIVISNPDVEPAYEGRNVCIKKNWVTLPEFQVKSKSKSKNNK